MFPASTRAEPSAAADAALPPPPPLLPKTPSDTFIRRSSPGLRPSTRRPSGLTHSWPDLSPRISLGKEQGRERKREFLKERTFFNLANLKNENFSTSTSKKKKISLCCTNSHASPRVRLLSLSLSLFLYNDAAKPKHAKKKNAGHRCFCFRFDASRGGAVSPFFFVLASQRARSEPCASLGRESRGDEERNRMGCRHVELDPVDAFCSSRSKQK